MTKKEKIAFLSELKAAINETTDFSCTYPVDEAIENFIWVSTKDERIGNSACHYEVIFNDPADGNPNTASVEVHFESATYKSFQGIQLSYLMFDKKSPQPTRVSRVYSCPKDLRMRTGAGEKRAGLYTRTKRRNTPRKRS